MQSELHFPRKRIQRFCQKWKIVELSFFGSVLREDFSSESDIDVLALFAEDARHTLFDMARMKMELQKILGREVDLVSKRGVENSRNYLRKNAILESSEVIYGS